MWGAAFPAFGREQGGGHLSPAKQGCKENGINRKGWALFKSLLHCVRYMKFRLKAMLVVNWRVEDQGPKQKLDGTTGESRRATPAVRTAGWLLKVGAGPGWSEFLFCGHFHGRLLVYIAVSKEFLFSFLVLFFFPWIIQWLSFEYNEKNTETCY